MNINSIPNNQLNSIKEETKKNTNEISTKIKTNNEKIDYSKYIKFTYNKKDKSFLGDMLFRMEENDDKLKNEVVNICSNNCFANLNCDFLSGNENICLINCFKKFSDSIIIGEKLLDEFEEGKLRKSLLIKGDFDRFRTDAYNKLV